MQRSQSIILANYFKEIVLYEKQLRNLFKEFTTIQQFQPRVLFEFLARNQPSITPSALKEYLKDKVAINDQEIFYILLRFDHRKMGSIVYQDFYRELGYKNKDFYNKSSKSINDLIEIKFLTAVNWMVKCFRMFYAWQKQMNQQKVYQLFESINYHQTGYITSQELDHFFFIQNQQIDPIQTKNLKKFLLQKQGMFLNLQIFHEALFPETSLYYQSYQNKLKSHVQQQIRLTTRRINQETARQLSQQNQYSNLLLRKSVMEESILLREHEIEARIRRQVESFQILKNEIKNKYRSGIFKLNNKEEIKENIRDYKYEKDHHYTQELSESRLKRQKKLKQNSIVWAQNVLIDEIPVIPVKYYKYRDIERVKDTNFFNIFEKVQQKSLKSRIR